MVELIVGRKGKGKTKVLLDKVNGAIKEVNGSIVYLDKSTKHMYELNNKVRLIDVSVYPIKNADEFVGFVCGIISQDHDLEQIYLDSFLTTAKLEGQDVTGTLDQLKAVGEKFGVNFIISMSLDKGRCSCRIPGQHYYSIIIYVQPLGYIRQYRGRFLGSCILYAGSLLYTEKGHALYLWSCPLNILSSADQEIQ